MKHDTAPKVHRREKETIFGSPERRYVSASYRGAPEPHDAGAHPRFTRLTNPFSKKIENHMAAISLHFMHYNFVRIHQSLRMSPAMAAGVTDRLWEISDIVALLEAKEGEIRKQARAERERRATAPMIRRRIGDGLNREAESTQNHQINRADIPLFWENKVLKNPLLWYNPMTSGYSVVNINRRRIGYRRNRGYARA